jgi:glycosyltransferase involved in cell wall biosynthesis
MKTKVCYVVSGVDRSHLFETLGEAMDKDKYEISFVFMFPQKPHLFEYFEARNYPVEFFEFSDRKKEFPLAVWKLRKIFRRLRPDIVHTHLFAASFSGLLAAKTLGLANRVHTRHHSVEAHLYYPHAVYYDKTVNAMARKIVAVSNSVADVLINRESVNPQKVVTIPHAFDLENFVADDRKVESIKQKYGLQNHYPVVGAISRFTHGKGLQYTIPAFREVLQTYPRAKLVLANASGPYKAEIQKLLDENVPADNYVTIKFEPDAFALYRAFDVFVHVPVEKDFEAFGQIYVEALALGAPSVFTLSGVANDFIRDGENAAVVPYHDAPAIAEKIKLILENESFRRKIVERGRADVWKLFHSKRLAAQLDTLYTELSTL